MEIQTLTLSKVEEIQKYFGYLLGQNQTGNRFPIDLELVWPLAYSRKDKAVRALLAGGVQDVDYQILPLNGQNSKAGRKAVNYRITVACMEWLIARKVRPVFEVYRRVFHKTMEEASQPCIQGKLFDIEPQPQSNIRELVSLIKQHLIHGDQIDVAKNIGVSPQTIVRALKGEIQNPCSPVLTALYNRAMHNKRKGLVIGNIKQAINKLKR